MKVRSSITPTIQWNLYYQNPILVQYTILYIAYRPIKTEENRGCHFTTKFLELLPSIPPPRDLQNYVLKCRVTPCPSTSLVSTAGGGCFRQHKTIKNCRVLPATKTFLQMDLYQRVARYTWMHYSNQPNEI